MRHRIKPPASNSARGWTARFERALRRILLRKVAQLEHGRITEESPNTFVIEQSAPLARRVTLHIRDPRCYGHILLAGTTGAAESYILGDWDCDDLAALIEIVLSSPRVYEGIDSGWAWLGERVGALLHLRNRNSPEGSLRNIMAHYDLGNDFFGLFLDETMAYSCGVFERPDSTLHEASLAKFERICRKLDLSRDDSLVEIGTGWGGFAIYAAQRYGCRVTTTTISREQYDEARKRVQAAGVGELVTVINQDYRDLTGTYSKLVSIEMIEAVGEDYLNQFLGICGRLLREDGLMAIQGITVPDDRYHKHRQLGSFINKYIFPGSHLVSVRRICEGVAAETDMFLASVEDITPHYARTLREWRHRFEANLDQVRAQGMSEAFIRMWRFYLVFCEAGFTQRWTGDVQWVFGKPRSRPPLLPLGEVT